MIQELNKENILKLVNKQLSSFFSCDFDFSRYLDEVLNLLEENFMFNQNKYYSRDNETYFSPFHSCQWLMFLYYLGHVLYKHNESMEVCSQLYYLNKIMHSIELYYEVEMPKHWFCDHPLGSVLGRAKYGDYFAFLQGCTIGQNHGIYPEIGDYVFMCAHSSIIGNCHIGKNVIIGANTNIKDQDIPENSLVFGNSPNLIIIKKTEEEQRKFFKQYWKL